MVQAICINLEEESAAKGKEKKKKKKSENGIESSENTCKLEFVFLFFVFLLRKEKTDVGVWMLVPPGTEGEKKKITVQVVAFISALRHTC